MRYIISIFMSLLCLSAAAQRKTCLDDGWKFKYGSESASATDYDDSQWRRFSLPHDWSVENEAAQAAGGTVIGPFSTNSVGKYQTGNTVGGEGWYRRTLRLSAADLKQRLVLYFEGAYNQSRVWVNGTQVAENVYGYMSFRADITAQCHEGENTIAVQVVNAGNNTRWYAGSGIYRHVWLLRTPQVYLDEWGAFVEIKNEEIKIKNDGAGIEDRRADASLAVQLALHNTTATAKPCSVCVNIIDAQEKKVATATQSLTLAENNLQSSIFNLQLKDAHLWSPGSPYRYTAVIRLTDTETGTTDTLVQRFGVRSIAYSATEGFLLNGEPTLLRGGCIHHDNGLLGAAAFDLAEDRKLQLLKDNGYNAVRCSHNLPSEHFLNACDSLGLMVIDECFDQWLRKKNDDDYHQYFPTHSTADIQTMVRRDRNHPSIIMWSIGNEIPGRIEPAGMEAAECLRQAVLELDTTRPITAAICGWDEGDEWNAQSRNWDIQDANAFQSLDIGGYNYLYDKYEHDHGTHPDRVMCGLESYPMQASQNWDLVEQKPYVIGDFVWTAMDYLGEAGIGSAAVRTSGNQSMFQGWPWYNGWCGDIDLIGQKKPQSYYRDVVWRLATITMGVERPVPSGSHQSISAWGWQLEEQHWTYPDLSSSDKMSVNVYSRAPRVRLYLNGKSLGDKATSSTYWAGFSVGYEPGTLRAVNLDTNGNEVEGEAFELVTTGEGVSLRILYDKNTISASTSDLVYATIELVDAQGRVVTSDSSTKVGIANAGCGELIATGTASPNDMESFRNNTLTLYRGRALAIIRGNGTAGTVSLSVDIYEKAKDFTSAYILTNPDFSEGSLTGWVYSTGNVRYNSGMWKDTPLSQYVEANAGWNGKSTLSGTFLSQSTKVLPRGQYTVTFDYNATIRDNGSYQTTGELSGVCVSAGGATASLTTLDASEAQTASLVFTLDEPKAVTLLFDFATDCNADWFALDNVQVEYAGMYDFGTSYTDMTDKIPPFDNNNWAKVSGNAAGAYTETKLGSKVYNGSGLAYWSSSIPKNKSLFEQTITGLPANRYGLAAFAAANRWSSSDNDRNHQGGTQLFAKAGSQASVTQEVTTATYGLYYLVVDLKDGEPLTIGLNATAQNGNNWCYLSGITLVALGDDKSDDIEKMKNGENEKARNEIYDLSGRMLPHTPKKGIYIKDNKKVTY